MKGNSVLLHVCSDWHHISCASRSTSWKFQNLRLLQQMWEFWAPHLPLHDAHQFFQLTLTYGILLWSKYLEQGRDSLLECFAAQVRSWAACYSHLHKWSSSRSFKMAPIYCPKTSVTNYQPMPCKISKQQRPQLHSCSSLKSWKSVNMINGFEISALQSSTATSLSLCLHSLQNWHYTAVTDQKWSWHHFHYPSSWSYLCNPKPKVLNKNKLGLEGGVGNEFSCLTCRKKN